MRVDAHWVLNDVQKELLDNWCFKVFANLHVCNQLDASLIEAWWNIGEVRQIYFTFPRVK